MHPFLTTFFLFVALTLTAQFEPLDAPVVGLPNGFAGGMNAPQWSAADLNNDGTADLVVFDRAGNTVQTFLWENGTYVYRPRYARHFPPVFNFALLRDYNQDGVLDLFTHFGAAIAGVVPYTGFFENDELRFEPFPLAGGDFAVLEFSTGSNSTNVYVANTDVPVLDDLDGDGDLDIVSFEVSGSVAYYYENQSQEQGFGNDSLRFTLADNCYGKFKEDAFTSAVILSDDPDECAAGLHDGGDDDDRNGLHPGSTIVSLDANGDGERDLLVGDVLSPQLTLLLDGAAGPATYFTAAEPNFPADDIPVELTDFPAAFHLDVNQDGARDLMVSPTLPNAVQNVEVAYFYENTGSDAAPNFEFVQRDFLVETMIDVGAGSSPAFFDYNADGLLDLVVGNQTYFLSSGNLDSRLALYENVGTATAPAFQLITDNWLDFKQYNAQTGGWAPTFGDLDGDGDADLLVGEREGRLFYAENTAAAGAPASFPTIEPVWQNIDVGLNATPTIADLTGDGLPDLLVGERNGNVNLLVNEGTADNPQFIPDPAATPNVAFYGQIDLRVFAQPGDAAPVALVLPDRTVVATGSRERGLELYEVTTDGAAFPRLAEHWGDVRAGRAVRPALADLDADGFLDMAVGNQRGGVQLVRTNLTTDGTTRTPSVAPLDFSLFPNPVTDALTVRLPDNGAFDYEILTIDGRSVHAGRAQRGPISTTGLPDGLYVLRIQTAAGERGYRRFVK